MNYRQQKRAKTKNFILPFYLLLRIFVIIGLITTVLWAWRLFHNPQFMPIKSVKLVATYQHIDQPTLAKIITPYITDTGLFAIEVEQLKQGLLQQPWIYSVLIKRIWPDEIEIDLVEQQAVVLWNNDGLLNSQGIKFTPDKKTFPVDLPLLQGPEGQEQQVFKQYNQFNSMLAPLNLKVNELELNSRGSWQMILSNNILVILGRTDIEQRLNRLLAVYPEMFANRAQDVISVDLRYTEGLAVKWRTPVADNNLSSNNLSSTDSLLSTIPN